MILGLLILCVIIAISAILTVVLKNRFKSDEKSFWKPLFLMTGAICLPFIVINFLYYFSIIFTNNITLKSSLNYTLIFGFALIPIISAITFLVYLIFWKLKNRKFILSLTAICFSVMIISTISTLGTLPKVFEYSIKNEKVFNYLKNYKAKNGVYPQDIDNIETKYENLYETFNDGQDFMLHLNNNSVLWTYCTTNKDNCFPKKWLFNVKEEHKWIDIPEQEKYRGKFFQKRGDFSTWTLERKN